MPDGFEIGMVFRHRESGLRIKVEAMDEKVLWCSYPDYPPQSKLQPYEKHPSVGPSFAALHKIESLPEHNTGTRSDEA